MEANVFRSLAAALGPQLQGRRVEKIYSPAPDVWTFKLQAVGGAPYLLLRTAGRDGLLLLTSTKPENPAQPSARCMWLRKRLVDRRLVDWAVDWPSRTIAFALSPGEGRFLVLAPQDGPDLVEELPAGFGAEPDWPDVSQVRDDPGLWRTYPQITPALRRLLAASPPGRAQAVLDAVRRGGGMQFFAYLPAAPSGAAAEARNAQDAVGASQKAAPQLLAWRLPESLRAGLEEHSFTDVVAAADFFGRATLYPQLARLAEAASRQRLDAERKRVRRALDGVSADRRRLEGLVARGSDGEALRGVLYQFDKAVKRPYVDLPAADGGTRRLDLDPRQTLLANMERLFRLAAKGRRGLEFIAGREERLRAELDALDRGQLPEDDGRPRRSQIQEPGRGAVVKPAGAVPGVARFRTSDGFVVLRGKSAQANHTLRKLANPFDLWFHAAHGPGAHVILRRQFPDQEVPETSLAEAAGLAALRSFAAGGRAEVMCAQVRHVRAVKGGGPGKVAVDRQERTLSVEPDPDLERRLADDGA